MSSEEESCPSHRNLPRTRETTRPEVAPVPEIRTSPLKDRDSGYKSKQSEPEVFYWKPPEIEVNDEAATRSFLASKLTDLANLADKLKARLHPDKTPAGSGMTSSAPVVVPQAVPASVNGVTQMTNTFFNSTSLASQGVSFASSGNGAANAASLSVAGQAESATPTFVPRSVVPQPVTSSFGDVSSTFMEQRLERLVELSDEEQERNEVSQRESLFAHVQGPLI